MFLSEVPGYQSATIIDVRTREEFDLGHPANAVNIPWDLHWYYLEELEELPKPWVFVCEEGRRAGFVVFSLKMLGYEDIYNAGRWIDVINELNSRETEAA